MYSDSLYFPLKVELDYSYSLGQLKPYFDALQTGRALASCCPECGRVNFPPKLNCEFDQSKSTWLMLTGVGTIRQVSVGRTETFALIQMDGASNLCLGRLDGKDFRCGDRVRLEINQHTQVDHPAQYAVFRRIDESFSSRDDRKNTGVPFLDADREPDSGQ